MKYLVLSVSHPGDGNFCLWDADDEYCVRRSGNKTDVVAALGQACGRYGIKLGVFYYPGLIPSYDKALMQVVELCDKYPAISQFRFHVQKKFDSLGRVDVYRVVKKTNPNCLVQQTGNGTPPALLEAAFPADVLGGFNLPPTKPFDPQLRFAGRDYYIPYEYLTSIFSGPNTWFYGEGVELRPANELFELYRECRESRCNFLLGMGPDRTGLIPEDQVARLMQLKAKIDAVYSAR
jgi:alpha-L-fucosidase